MEPAVPQYALPANNADFNIVIYNAYKARLGFYKIVLASYND